MQYLVEGNSKVTSEEVTLELLRSKHRFVINKSAAIWKFPENASSILSVLTKCAGIGNLREHVPNP